MPFKGFDPSILGFLDELAQNNERDWFIENKDRYERLVREPALDFIVAMGPLLDRIAPEFEAVAKKMGGSLMRVFRDTRFGRDKTPYKTNVGIQFRLRIAKGSGRSVQEVNQLVSQFKQMQKVMKVAGKPGAKLPFGPRFPGQ